MKTPALLFCLLGTIQSLPILQLMRMYPVQGLGQQQAQQFLPGMGLPPANLVLDQPTLVTPQQPNQLFPPLGQIPLTQMFSLGTDMQLINPATGLVPSIQILPMTLMDTNTAQQVSPQQMFPVIVAQVGTQGTLLSSEELPMAPQIFTGLLIQPLGTGAMLPTGQERINANTQDAALPAGQTGGNPAFWGTPEGQFPTPSGPDDTFEATIPVGIQRTAEGSTTEAPNGGFFQTHKMPLGPKKTAEGSVRQLFLGDLSAMADVNPIHTRELPSTSELTPTGGNLMIPLIAPQDPDSTTSPTMLILRGDTHLPM
ncbi:amelotin [Trichosurus vulpecula]|uniref:amelotin n=1 Tax=Trichosurus vulpecula TaxID=9337 RepID=UPI00186B576F|nr:amelotin [Trichosurus vulpecula]